LYGEGIYIGYRHYDRIKIEPQFAFGHGLSYTTFAYGSPVISSSTLTDGGRLVVSVPVTNTGLIRGKETVQAYIRDVKSRLPRPEKELAAFAKVDLETGETKTVELNLDRYSVGYWDGNEGKWIAEQGEFEVLVGASSRDIRGTAFFEVKDSFTWIF
jgi:beta-glucosidase